MNQRDDLGEATPGDWLGVVESGQHWGFPDCYGQGGTACAGVPDPAGVLDPHAAVSGVAVASPTLAGGGTGTLALVAEWNAGRVMAVDLSTDESGAMTSTVRPFLTGLQRPEPLLTTPSGSLLAGDWASGTVYEVTTTSPASST
jgi:glucose/arabinose dehydrogenase